MKIKPYLLIAALILTCLGLGAAEFTRLGMDSGYLFRLGCALALGLLTALGIRRKRLLPLPALLLLLLGALGSWRSDWLQELGIALYPLLAVLWADSLCRFIADFQKRRSPWLFLLYYPPILALAALLQYRSQSWLRFEPVGTLCLLLIAGAALLCVPLRGSYYCQIGHFTIRGRNCRTMGDFQEAFLDFCFRGMRMRLFRQRISLFFAALALIFLSHQDRIYDILWGRAGLGNWLDYRLSALAGLEAASLLPALPGLFLLLLGGLALRKLSPEHPFLPHCRGLFAALCIRHGLGLMSRLLVVPSSGVAPLLVSQPWDAVTLAALAVLLFPVKQSSEVFHIEENRYRPLRPHQPPKILTAPSCQAAEQRPFPEQNQLDGCPQRQDPRKDPSGSGEGLCQGLSTGSQQGHGASGKDLCQE